MEMYQPKITFGQTIYFRDGERSCGKSHVVSIKALGDCGYEYTVWGHSGEMKRRHDEVAASLSDLKALYVERENNRHDAEMAIINAWKEK
jgi:hypothetical protein